MWNVECLQLCCNVECGVLNVECLQLYCNVERGV